MQKDKIRDMLRSILPSKAERSARFEKAYANRCNRTKVRQALHQFKDEDWEGGDEDKMLARINNSDQTRAYDIRMMKRERREADKISHFVRWCERKTAHIPEDKPQEKYYYISGLIGGPSDIIREHALGHFMQPDYDFNIVARERWSRYRWTPGVEGSGEGLFDRTAFTQALLWAYEHCPAQLNQALKNNNGRGGFSEPALLWRGCTDDDGCTEHYATKEPYYTWQTTSGYQRTGWVKPFSYREGTLVSQTVSRDNIRHNSAACENKILVSCKEDIERIVDKVFGNSKVYHKPYYGRDTQHSLYGRLTPFLVAKNLLEERSD